MVLCNAHFQLIAAMWVRCSETPSGWQGFTCLEIHLITWMQTNLQAYSIWVNKQFIASQRRQNNTQQTHTSWQKCKKNASPCGRQQGSTVYKRKQTPTLMLAAPAWKSSSTRQIFVLMLNLITLFTVSVCSEMCKSASAPQRPTSCHYCAVLYCCRNLRWQATFPGRLGKIPPPSARCRQNYLMTIALDMRTQVSYILSEYETAEGEKKALKSHRYRCKTSKSPSKADVVLHTYTHGFM